MARAPRPAFSSSSSSNSRSSVWNKEGQGGLLACLFYWRVSVIHSLEGRVLRDLVACCVEAKKLTTPPTTSFSLSVNSPHSLSLEAKGGSSSVPWQRETGEGWRLKGPWEKEQRSGLLGRNCPSQASSSLTWLPCSWSTEVAWLVLLTPDCRHCSLSTQPLWGTECVLKSSSELPSLPG